MRNAFSKTEDQRLVEYLAKYNPGPEGRQGKILYQHLADNPWARSHPWQSWRERYKKNMETFDIWIARHLKENKEATKKPATNANGVERAAQKGAVKPDLPEKTKNQGTSKRNVGNSSTKPTDKDVPGPKGKANTSADSGYASAKGTHPNVSEGNSETRQASMREASSMKAGRPQGTSGISKESSGVGSQLAPAKKPIEPVPVAQPEEIEESASDAAENELATGPVDDDYVHELFGSYVEEEEEEEEEDQDGPPPSPAMPIPTSAKLYPGHDPSIIEKGAHMQGTSSPQPPPVPSQTLTSRKPTSSTAAVHQPAQVTKTLKRKVHDDDPFVDNTPPSSPRRSMDPRAPPILKEGPFRNTYVPARRRIEDDGKAWPPKRRRKNDEQSETRPLVHSSTTIVPERGRQTPATQSLQHVGLPRHQHANAVASSSKVMLPAIRRDTSLLQQTANELSHPQTVPQRVQELDYIPKAKHPESINFRPDSTSKLPIGAAPVPTKRQKIDHRSEHTHPASRSDVVGHEPSAPSPAWAEPSILNASKGKARGDNPPSTRRVDLREERLHMRRSSLRSSIVSSRASTASNPNSISKDPPRRESAVSSGSRRSRHSIVSVKDAELIPLFKQVFAEIGKKYGFSVDIVETTFKETCSLEKTRARLEILQKELPELGKKYGFSTEVVENTFRDTGSLEKTHELLKDLNKVMRGAQQVLYDRMLRRSGEDDVEDEEDQIPNGLVPGQAYSARREEFGRKGVDLANSQGERSSGSLTKRNRPSLNYKPLIVADDMSDYSPPSKTRARRYAKLRKEGREKEALEAAIGFYHSSRTRGNSTVLQSDVRTEATDGEVGSSPENQQYHPAIIRGMEPSSPLEMEASPTPAMKTVPKQTDDQREDDDPGDDMDVVSLDGDDQPSIEGANQVRVGMEYKKLALEVTLQDQEAMLALERENDPWLLKQWSSELIEERVAAAREAQEARKQQQQRAAENAIRIKRESQFGCV